MGNRRPPWDRPIHSYRPSADELARLMPRPSQGMLSSDLIARLIEIQEQNGGPFPVVFFDENGDPTDVRNADIAPPDDARDETVIALQWLTD